MVSRFALEYCEIPMEDELPSTVMIEFIVTGQSHQCAESWTKGEVNLFSCLHPDVDITDLLPLRP